MKALVGIGHGKAGKPVPWPRSRSLSAPLLEPKGEGFIAHPPAQPTSTIPIRPIGQPSEQRPAGQGERQRNLATSVPTVLLVGPN
jgi:hypothetical protein